MEKLPDAEPLSHQIPEAFVPKEDGPRFPELTRENLAELAKNGWERIGVIVLLLNPAGEVLVAVHGPGNPKVPENMMGVISETLKIEADSVEQPVPGISRLFSEELEMTSEEIQSLNLQTVEHGAWQNVTFPLRGGRDALGMVIVLEADEKSVQILSGRGANLTPRSEIKFISFMDKNPLAHGAPVTENFRPATARIFQAAMELLTTPQNKSRLELPPPKKPTQKATEDLKDLLHE